MPNIDHSLRQQIIEATLHPAPCKERRCSKCNMLLESKYRYCPSCGRAVEGAVKALSEDIVPPRACQAPSSGPTLLDPLLQVLEAREELQDDEDKEVVGWPTVESVIPDGEPIIATRVRLSWSSQGFYHMDYYGEFGAKYKASTEMDIDSKNQYVEDEEDYNGE